MRCPVSETAEAHGDDAYDTRCCGLLVVGEPLLASKSWLTDANGHASCCFPTSSALQLSQQLTWRGRALSKGDAIFVVAARTKGLSGSIPALSASNTDAGGLQ